MTKKPLARAPGGTAAGSAASLFKQRLAESGLDETDARELGYDLLTNAEVRAYVYTKDTRPALYLPYLDPFTNEPLGDLPFYRLRLLGSEPSTFGEQPLKPRRYLQPAGAGPYAYFPLFEGAGWPALLGDPDVPLVITEGELKAACATKHGFPTIGLGGVHNFMSRRKAVEFLDELAQVVWEGRNVYVAYDSDAATKPQVRQALLWLASLLSKRGATVYDATLPGSGSVKKQGLDDFLVDGGDLAAVLAGAPLTPMAHLELLWRLNTQFVHVRKLHRFLEIGTGTLHKKDSFDTLCLQYPYREPTGETDKQGREKFKDVPASKAWLAWPFHAQVNDLVYEPQAPGEEVGRYLPHPSGSVEQGSWNLWPGWGVAPSAGDVAPFLRLLDYFFTESQAEYRTWFLRWLAYPLQHPGVKLYTGVMLVGPQGSGKSLLAEVLERLYGENYRMITNAELTSKFTKWLDNKQFIFGDEITGSDKLEQADRLKHLITGRKTRIELKGLDDEEKPARANFLFATNRPDPLKLDDDDRRFFVHELGQVALPLAFYNELGAWKNGDGPAALFRYLLELDLADFDPHAKAPMTQAKREMIDSGRSPLEAWLAELRESPDQALTVEGVTWPLDLYTHAELRDIYNQRPEARRPVAVIYSMLKRYGFERVLDGRTVRGPKGSYAYYAVRNVARWQAATYEEVAAYLKDPTSTQGKVVTTSAKRKY